MSATSSRRRVSSRRLRWTYDVPRPMLDEEQFRRFHHLDLPDFERWQLDAELSAVLRRLSLEHDPFDREWLIERRAAIRSERDRPGGTVPEKSTHRSEHIVNVELHRG